MTNIEKYLNRIVDYMIRHSKNNELPFDSTRISFNDYCRHSFGLTDDEIDYVWYKYRYLMGWDEHDRSPKYLKKVLDNY